MYGTWLEDYWLDGRNQLKHQRRSYTDWRKLIFTSGKGSHVEMAIVVDQRYRNLVLLARVIDLLDGYSQKEYGFNKYVLFRCISEPVQYQRKKFIKSTVLQKNTKIEKTYNSDGYYGVRSWQAVQEQGRKAEINNIEDCAHGDCMTSTL